MHFFGELMWDITESIDFAKCTFLRTIKVIKLLLRSLISNVSKNDCPKFGCSWSWEAVLGTVVKAKGQHLNISLTLFLSYQGESG